MNELATKKDLAITKSIIIKWMFIFWVGQLAAMIAIAKLVFHA
jgi:hypothetical protein